MTSTTRTSQDDSLEQARRELNEQIVHLGNCRLKMFAFPVNEFLRSRPVAERLEFIGKREEFSLAYTDIRNRQLRELLSDFEPLLVQLQAGINNLDAEINALESTVAILNAIGALVGTIRRLAGLLA